MSRISTSSPKSRLFLISLCVLYLLSIYTEVPLFLSETFYVPSFLTVFSIPVFLFYHRKYITQRDVFFLMKIFLVLLLSAFASPGIAFIGHKISGGVLQTTVSIIGGMLLVKTIDRLERRQIAFILYWLSVVLLVGTILEVSGVIREVSDRFRVIAYAQSAYGVYSSDSRDLILAGFERPKFFTSEPSLLALGFFAFSNSWLILSYNKRNFLMVCGLTLIMLYLTASAVLVIGLAMSIAIMFFYTRASYNLFYSPFLILVLFFVVVFLVPDELFNRLGSRFIDAVRNFDKYAISSENMRVVFPFITMMDILKNSPLFGVGISGNEMIDVYTTLPFDTVVAFGNNNIAALFSYFGVVGAGLFILIFYKYLDRFFSIKQWILFIVIYLGLSTIMGGFQSPRFWGYVFLFIGVLKKSSEMSTPAVQVYPKRRLALGFRPT